MLVKPVVYVLSPNSVLVKRKCQHEVEDEGFNSSYSFTSINAASVVNKSPGDQTKQTVVRGTKLNFDEEEITETEMEDKNKITEILMDEKFFRDERVRKYCCVRK